MCCIYAGPTCAERPREGGVARRRRHRLHVQLAVREGGHMVHGQLVDLGAGARERKSCGDEVKELSLNKGTGGRGPLCAPVP